MIRLFEWKSQTPTPNDTRTTMESIAHRTVEVNGISMHVAEKGEGPVVLLIHGFPELWYSWRHQILGLAAQGYRAVAPDLRGYGGTDAPADQSSYSIFHIVGDVVALISSLGQQQVFVVGHDWGAIIAWKLCLFRPDLVRALVNLSVVYKPRSPARKPMERLSVFGDELYVLRFQEPGLMEAEFARLGTKLVLKKAFAIRDPNPLMIPKKGWGSPDDQVDLVPWLSEEEINYFTNQFEKSGFTGPLNYYRCMDLSWELTAPWTGAQIKVPTKFIVGDLDLTYYYPGVQHYIHKGGFKKDVPLLEDVVVMEGVGRFTHQEKGEEITEHILDFIKKF